MNLNSVVIVLLAIAVGGFLFGMLHMHAFKREGGDPSKMLEPQVGLGAAAEAAKRKAIVGFGIFFCFLAVLLAITSVFGPAKA